VPEHIGYLKTLGLEYGWGPTAVVEWCLEHIHVLLGTPWWASIILTAVAFRIIMVKPYMDAADNSAKLAHVGPITKPMTIKMRELAAKQDTPGVMAIRSEISMINKRAGIKMYKSFVPLIQMFLGFGTFRLMNGMAHLPVPGLETGGLLWFHNLAIADPYFILPLATSAMMFVVMKVRQIQFHSLPSPISYLKLTSLVMQKGGETGSSQMSPNTMRLMAYGFPALSFMFTWWLPAAIQLSFFITSVWSAGQVALFNNPSFRNRFGIYPLPEKPNTLDANVVISPYKEHIKVQEMKMKYEPPTAPDAKTTLLGGLKKEISSATEGIKKTASGAAKSLREVAGQERVDGKRTKAELKRAQQYEEMRSKQEKERLLSLDARRREERLRKKAERDAQRKL
jgi:YidC/Oxa1 family membrane protein insertase